MIQLFVSGLPLNVDEQLLKKMLSGLEGVEWAELIRDLDSGESRGMATIRFINDWMASKGLEYLQGIKGSARSLTEVRYMPATLPGEMALRDWLHRFAQEVLIDIGIVEGQTVLDYGCGEGTFTIPCAKIVGSKGKVYALDSREEALQTVNKSMESEELTNIGTVLQKGGLLPLPFADGTVDVVLVYDVMHMTKDKLALLKELHRLLKNKGWLSVFPMHMGNEPMLEVALGSGLFQLRDNYCPRVCQSPSTILNFDKL